MQVACEHVFGERSLNGRRVLVQGAGSVGAALIDYLRSAGADVMFSDVAEKSICRIRDDFNFELSITKKITTEAAARHVAEKRLSSVT